MPIRDWGRIINQFSIIFENRSSYIGLGHELGRAKLISEGKHSKILVPGLVDPDTKKKGILTKGEVSVRKIDSKIRKEQNVIERKTPYY